MTSKGKCKLLDAYSFISGVVTSNESGVLASRSYTRIYAFLELSPFSQKLSLVVLAFVKLLSVYSLFY